MSLLSQDGSVGLEFDTGVIRAVELRGSGGPVSLVTAGRVEIPRGAVVEGVVADVGVVAEALERLWSSANIGGREVTLGISNHGVLMRMATFPKVPEKKLAQIVRFQSGEYFPIPLNQMVLDFAVVGESEGEGGPVFDVLLVAARRDLLDKSLDALQAAGLKPVVVDPSPLALMRAVPENDLAGTVIFADISNGLTTVMLTVNGVPRLSRVVPGFMNNSANQLQPEAQEAAAAAEGLPGMSGQIDDIELWGPLLAEEIRSSVGYYLAQNNIGTVDRIIISGRGATAPGLDGLLQEQLEVRVLSARPVSVLGGYGKTRDVDMEKYGPEFAVSIGLALRGLED
ncbi:MAG: type IV pilus biogenesis protein PilM [Bacillota bacterium]